MSRSGYEKNHYINEIGTLITVDCGQNITTATTKILEVRKPDGTMVKWTAAISGTTSLVYTTQSGDFDQIGTYSVQPYLVLPTWTGRGETVTFEVLGYFDVGF